MVRGLIVASFFYRFLIKIKVCRGPGPAPAGPWPRHFFYAPAPAGPRPRKNFLAPAPEIFFGHGPGGVMAPQIFLAPAPGPGYGFWPRPQRGHDPGILFWSRPRRGHSPGRFSWPRPRAPDVVFGPGPGGAIAPAIMKSWLPTKIKNFRPNLLPLPLPL